MSTRPEKRVDKNGVLVTRHVKDGVEESQAPSIRIKNLASASAVAQKSIHFRDPSFKEARSSFLELNPGQEPLFDDFYLGSGLEITTEDVLKKNPDLEEDDIHVAILSNGLNSYWLKDENIELPEDQELVF